MKNINATLRTKETPEQKKPILRLAEISFAYPGQPAILEQISLTVCENDFLVISGPNGSGKTTLLKIILGLLKAQKGTAQIGGGLPPKPVIGYLPQKAHINSGFPATVWEVLTLAARQRKNKAQAWETMVRVGLLTKKDALLGTLSGGQLQRVFLARALLNKPEIIILDEPANNLDNRGKQELYQLLAALHQEGLTIIAVTHDLAALRPYASRLLLMANKKVTEIPPEKWKVV
jgi:zinc transport system ATP-binding protein